VNKNGSDVFVYDWLKKRATEKTIRHALIVGKSIVANERAVVIKNYFATQRKNINRNRQWILNAQHVVESRRLLEAYCCLIAEVS
jgi:hypothetical protein